MPNGKKRVADSIRLPGERVETLKVMAESEGERGYQTMVRKWIEDRLHQEARKYKRVSEPTAGFSRYNTTPEVDQEQDRAI